MPTDALQRLRDVMAETRDYGFERVRAEQIALGQAVRRLFAQRGLASVAAPGFEAPGVVVSYTDDPDIHSGRRFIAKPQQETPNAPKNDHFFRPSETDLLTAIGKVVAHLRP